MPAYEVQVIKRLAELASIEVAWRDLYQADPRATPFQSPDWILAWCDRFQPGRLATVVVWLDGQPVALAPLYILPWNGGDQLTFLANGPSDFLDILIRPGHDVTRLILCALANEHWDHCDLPDLRADSPLAQTNFPTAVYPAGSVILPSLEEEFHRNLPHGLKRNLSRYSRHAETSACIQFETLTGGQIESDLPHILELHECRQPGKHDNAFVADAVTRLAKAGAALLTVLRADGEIAAANILLRHRDVVYGYLTAFDEKYSAFRPGTLVLAYSMLESIRAGAYRFEFLRGDEDYKKQWGATFQPLYRMACTREQFQQAL